MKVAIFPGSFKPPHKGHFNLLEKIIQNNEKYDFDKIYIFISFNPRPLDPLLYEPNSMTSDDLYRILKVYDKSIEYKLTKKEYIDIFKRLIEDKKIPYVNAEQSLKIWEIYKKIIEDKFGTKNKDKKIPEIIIKISYAPSPILSTATLVSQLIKKSDIKPNNIYLLKSLKNKNNQRFDYILKNNPKVKVNIIKSKEPQIHSRIFRKAIMDQDKKVIEEYLPDELTTIDKNKIMKILFVNGKKIIVKKSRRTNIQK